MSLSYSSALWGIQREVWTGRHTDVSLGNSTADMESDGGRERGTGKRPVNKEADAAEVGLQDDDGSPWIHKIGCSPCSSKAHCDEQPSTLLVYAISPWWIWRRTYSPLRLLITSRSAMPWFRWDPNRPHLTFQHPTMQSYMFITSLSST